MKKHNAQQRIDSLVVHRQIVSVKVLTSECFGLNWRQCSLIWNDMIISINVEKNSITRLGKHAHIVAALIRLISNLFSIFFILA